MASAHARILRPVNRSVISPTPVPAAGASTPSHYLLVLRANQSWLKLDFAELWDHRDLLKMLVRRDIIARYQQTLLGPAWFLLQPLIMASIFSVVFARAARVPTDGVPPLLFYLSSLLGWSFFSQCVSSISTTFTSNADLFGKVYFPRLIVPGATVISNLVTMGLQFLMFLGFFAYYTWLGPQPLPSAGWRWLLLPLLVIQTAAFALGAGLLFASFTQRYRDLLHALQFLVLGWMFLTPVFIPLSHFSGKLAVATYLNPMAPIIESFREVMLGVGSVEPVMVAVSLVETVFVLLVGIMLFQRAARTAVDTI
jgi:homopolymeric O-antigen transport system permease protein